MKGMIFHRAPIYGPLRVFLLLPMDYDVVPCSCLWTMTLFRVLVCGPEPRPVLLSYKEHDVVPCSCIWNITLFHAPVYEK